MTAPQGLRFETLCAEAKYMEVQKKLDELARHHSIEERHAQAEYDATMSAINERFEVGRAELSAQLPPPSREHCELVLRRNRDLELEFLHRTHRQNAEERAKRYEEQKRILNRELFEAVNSVMKSNSAFGSVALPPPPRFPEVSRAHAGWPKPAAADVAHPAPIGYLPPRPIEVPPVPSSLPAPSALDAHRSYGAVLRSSPSEQPGARFQDPLLRRGQATPIAPYPRRVENGHLTPRVASPDKSPRPHHVLSRSPPRPSPAPESRTRTPLPSARVSPERESSQKRRVDEQDGQARGIEANRAKRAKLDDGSRIGSPAASPVPPRLAVPAEPASTGSPASVAAVKPSDRTVAFEEVYGAPGKPVQFRHMIVQFPHDTGDFYILRCDKHGVHFGEHPLRGAAKHLASAQHGFMTKAHVVAIETLGYRVIGCTKEMADMNNKAVLQAFRDGYKIFNANNMSQAKRAELGYPPLDPLNSQKVAMHRKQQAAGNAAEAVPCRFYVASGGDLKYPVLILPWDDLRPAGLQGSLADTGLFRAVDGALKLPKCYVYHEDASGEIKGIKGWAKGYESGGPYERKREFPVLCVEGHDSSMWTVGWVRASHLTPLDFNDKSARDVPYFEEARNYYFGRVLRHRGEASNAQTATGTPRQARSPGARNDGEDVEMTDAGQAPEQQESDAESNVPSKDGPEASSTSMAAIAVQALTLQTPTNSFTAINSEGGGSRTPRSAGVSPEPPSRTGSFSSSSNGASRRVIKIHARSSRKSSDVALPERLAERAAAAAAAAAAATEAPRPSPTSLQHILQDESAIASTPSQSPKLSAARHPLPSGRARSSSPNPAAPKSATGEELPDAIHANAETRASSAPVQLPASDEMGPSEADVVAAAAATVPRSRQPTPPSVTEEAASTTVEARQEESAEKPSPSAQPPLAIPSSATIRVDTTPLDTPTPSAGNTRSSSPALTQPTTASRAETPAATPAPATPGSAEAFEIAGVMEGDAEVYRAETSGQPLRLLYEPQHGVLATPADAPYALRVDLQEVKAVERVSAQNGTTCVVTIRFGDGGRPALTLVLGLAKSTQAGMLNGVGHARRLCSRLQAWNGEIVCPAITVATESVKWRFADETMTPTSAVSSSSSSSSSSSVASEKSSIADTPASEPALVTPLTSTADHKDPLAAAAADAAADAAATTTTTTTTAAASTSKPELEADTVIAVAGEA
ncbi:hypothetical protein VTJ83DRAFT_5331 [Remersonia thermophila]|uniref:Uncharacterized protein n=1 Tax=Remersonia thermophila TaxID=72144 RepID=A0ABR4D8Q2_9PEZI